MIKPGIIIMTQFQHLLKVCVDRILMPLFTILQKCFTQVKMLNSLPDEL
ncbi:Uncharacterised protein [Dorea longicatena]|nr:Uncharacterised protein [Dorea longicatena]